MTGIEPTTSGLLELCRSRSDNQAPKYMLSPPLIAATKVSTTLIGVCGLPTMDGLSVMLLNKF